MEPPIHNPEKLSWRRNRREVDGGCHQTIQESRTGFPGKAISSGDSNNRLYDQEAEDKNSTEYHTGESPRRNITASPHSVLTMEATPNRFLQLLQCVAYTPSHITYRIRAATYRRARTDSGLGSSHINYRCNCQEKFPGLAAYTNTNYTVQYLDYDSINIFTIEGPGRTCHKFDGYLCNISCPLLPIVNKNQK